MPAMQEMHARSELGKSKRYGGSGMMPGRTPPGW